jgi:hypothetical protein
MTRRAHGSPCKSEHQVIRERTDTPAVRHSRFDAIAVESGGPTPLRGPTARMPKWGRPGQRPPVPSASERAGNRWMPASVGFASGFNERHQAAGVSRPPPVAPADRRGIRRCLFHVEPRRRSVGAYGVTIACPTASRAKGEVMDDGDLEGRERVSRARLPTALVSHRVRAQHFPA